MRKGIVSGQLVLIALVLLFVFGTIAYLTVLKDWGVNVTETNICTQSIATAMRVRDTTGGLVDFESLQCPARHTDYEEEDVEVLKGKIADDILKCWVKTGRNENNLGKDLALGLDRTNRDEDFCLVCSTFTLPQEVDLSDLIDYMETTPATVNSKNTYKDAIQTGWSPNGNSLWGIFQNKQTFKDGKANPIYGIPRDRSEGFTTHPDALKAFPDAYFIVAVNPADEKRTADYNHVMVIEEGVDLDFLSCDEFRYQPVGTRKTSGTFEDRAPRVLT